VLFEGAGGLREDVVETPLGSEAGLANAPQRGPGYFKVPKVVER
jgi:Asp-tRNA(Asn)/Glu-tRNA(Gln) amidotransferase C subunit